MLRRKEHYEQERLAGFLSDRIGRLKTIFFVCLPQAFVMFFSPRPG